MIKRKANIPFLTQRFDTISDLLDALLRLPLNKIYSEEVNESLPGFCVSAIGI
jgi:hypothetical protein